MNFSSHSPFTFSNVRRFIAFRAFFNVRFYYPVFTILFLDYGLSIEQFALLNTVWAFTIVLAEVPSGALADLIGRKRLLVTTSLLMIAEMMLLSFVPLGNSKLVFGAFLLNRILSGLAEALASGADEAMAYDTLVAEGDPEDWPKVLDVQMRVRNFFYIITMTIGALVYSPDTVNSGLHWLGLQVELDQQVTMRFPIYLTLGLGILTLFTTMGMHDPVTDKNKPALASTALKRIQDVSRITLNAGAWILHTPTALAVILFGMSFDHVLRMLVTMTSQYYRIIDLPEASFGVIGSCIAMLGLVVPRIARAMVEHFGPTVNVALVGGLALLSLWGLTFFTPILGILPMALIFVTMMLTSFFTSHYLNQIAEPHQRATVLSYKGLAFNAAYGFIGIFYAGIIANLRDSVSKASPDFTVSLIENEAFRLSIYYFPWYLIGILSLITATCLLHFRLLRSSR
ncbi:Major Facilitator Superfamily transporter [Desulfocapsa sulfexigens DSM 10523]|uniref:Major Facilitator Superfamily transporter n=1 Tax=Desulfocapsa sulfexigens (strain DSM 10523 / SB164P1) TaxID=1167006 RepID=M1P6K1_DESSD|nr:MFS transporter [Desulfocapsa sulfexigens]AGF79073.1 Major Facilitator Superfamily transporter [Desulfocapsa sulfexigens DSM 10523]